MSKKYIYVLILTLLLFTFAGYTFSWFSASVIGNDAAEYIVTETGTLSLLYTDTSELSFYNAKPGDTVTKTFTVKNTGTLDTEYSINWVNLINTITNNELKASLECISKNSNNNVSGTCENIEKFIPYSRNESSRKIKDNISITSGFTHEYTLTIEFIETEDNQNYNQGKTFSGKINISGATPIPVNNCTYDGELVQGAEYTNGQYTYRYKQQGTESSWENINEDGWGVKLTDKDSTDPVTTKLCTSINDKPIVSMAYAFYYSKSTSINLSGFDTSKVTDMSWMFAGSKATTLDLSSFDTSNVTDMDWMFRSSQATTLDLSNFDTSNVTDMSDMFAYSQATTLDLSNFDTSKVINMSAMFYGTEATTLDLSGFDTSNVTNMNSMFERSEATTLDLSSFDTSKVTDMSHMFYGSKATTLDLSNFNTSNVTNMYGMFGNSQATTLDLSSFDTSKVTNMSYMFWHSHATTLDLSSFDTSKVTNMSSMFLGSEATTLDLSSFDTSNVTNMSLMFDESKATTIYVSNKWNVSRVTSSSYMFRNTTNLVGGAGTRYSSSNPNDKTYARVDGGTSNPGYFTYKASN